MTGCIRQGEAGFPEILTERVPDLKTLYYDGDPTLLKTCCIAVVGSRKCTQYGKTVAREIGRRLGKNGVTLVSGLARGIDAQSHLGVLEAGGKTIAILAGGTDHIYPRQNEPLYREIAANGLLLSEHPPGYVAKPYDFPRRNRMISGIAESVVVVEAGMNSGALITAEYGMDQGKRVYAVPGNITSQYSAGTNRLIREKAEPLIYLDDLFLDLGMVPDIIEDNLFLGKDEKRIYDEIKKSGETTIDDLYHKTNMKLSEINGIITILEMKGIIFSNLGKVCVAKF